MTAPQDPPTHAVRVGERAIVTPKGTAMAVPTAVLAAAIATEWPSQPRAKLDPRQALLRYQAWLRAQLGAHF